MNKSILLVLVTVMFSVVVRAEDDGDGDDVQAALPSTSTHRMGASPSSGQALNPRMTPGKPLVIGFPPKEVDLDIEFDGTVYSEKCGAAQAFRHNENAWAIAETIRKLEKLKKFAVVSESKATGKWELDHTDIYDVFDPDGGDAALIRAFFEFRQTSLKFLSRLAVGGDLDRELMACTVRSSGVVGRGTALYNSILYSKKFLISRIVLSKNLSDESLRLVRSDVGKCLANYWEEAADSILVGPHGLEKRVAFPAQCPRDRFLKLREDLRQAFRELIEPFSGDQFSSESGTASVH